jgi:2-octaprenyl-6-methoxyphenol hydroxylase
MQSAAETCDVLIAGGSYAGLALALALSHESGGDLRIRVVSPVFPAPIASGTLPSDARGSALSRASLSLLSRIGVWPELSNHAQPVSEIVLTDSDLGDAIRPEVLRYQLDAGDAAQLPSMVIVENGRLGAALHVRAAAAPGIVLTAGTSITAFKASIDHVDATLSTGTTLTARLLVAADGGRSHLRELARIGTVGWPYAQTGIVTIVTPEISHNGRATQHFLPAGPFALLPMANNRVCVTWTEDAAEAKRILALDPTAFRAEVEHRFGHDLGALATISPPQSWPLEIGIARELTAERFALIGDAAHTLHPIAGQGLNLGLRDVAALTDAVIDTARLGLDIGTPDTLSHYVRARRFDNLTSAAGFDALNRLFSTRSTLARSARGAALQLVDRLPNFKQLIIAEAAGQSGTVPRLLRPLG